ncbi:hypothetical protein [Coleofasciculus sp. FACHB-SPT9]|uniref:hypothetical protein n=1 Tax=Cyanophyceae TaxID=3028117 RepID=UPI001682AD5E|nr:hypothetical protein [Coleofasciculus sp. FACHB-SPT9]MBD1891486.1 hypothetical protein [Coleofasciculus sp. FACHB-SPT9]
MNEFGSGAKEGYMFSLKHIFSYKPLIDNRKSRESIMPNGYWYYFVEPMLNEYTDKGDKEPIASIDLEFSGDVYQLALFGTNQVLHFIRIKVPHISPDMPHEIPEIVGRRIQIAKEHTVSTLRLIYDNKVALCPFSCFNFIEEDMPPNLNIVTNETLNNQWKFPNELFVAGFQNTINCRNEVKLLADSLDERIPLQYRYLSLFKIFEIMLFDGTKPRKELDVFLAKYESQFASKFQKKMLLKSYLIDLRARCAHIKSNKNLMGVTMLNNKDAGEVEAFLPFAFQIAKELVNTHPENNGLHIG